MRFSSIVLLLPLLLFGCSLGESDQIVATVGKPTDQRYAERGEEIGALFNKKGDKLAVFLFGGMTSDRRVIIHKKVSAKGGLLGKSAGRTEKIMLTLHQSLRFTNGSRIICLAVESDKLTYRRVSL